MVNLKKKCNCWTCKISPKIRKFEKTLTHEQKVQFEKFFGEVWGKLELAETDLGVLNSKIEGTWPKNDEEDLPIEGHMVSEGYYTRVGKQLYWIYSIKLND